jgi:hypothetical protein
MSENEIIKYSDNYLKQKFSNNDRFINLLEEFNTMTDEYDILCFIEKVFENWLVNVIDGYSSDYKRLDKNWGFLCNQMNIRKRKIILVSDLNFDDGFSILKLVCERITTMGFLIRRECEFVKCVKCGLAIPSEDLYDKLKLTIPKCLPKKWENQCSDCF